MRHYSVLSTPPCIAVCLAGARAMMVVVRRRRPCAPAATPPAACTCARPIRMNAHCESSQLPWQGWWWRRRERDAPASAMRHAGPGHLPGLGPLLLRVLLLGQDVWAGHACRRPSSLALCLPATRCAVKHAMLGCLPAACGSVLPLLLLLPHERNRAWHGRRSRGVCGRLGRVHGRRAWLCWRLGRRWWRWRRCDIGGGSRGSSAAPACRRVWHTHVGHLSSCAIHNHHLPMMQQRVPSMGSITCPLMQKAFANACKCM